MNFEAGPAVGTRRLLEVRNCCKVRESRMEDRGSSCFPGGRFDVHCEADPAVGARGLQEVRKCNNKNPDVEDRESRLQVFPAGGALRCEFRSGSSHMHEEAPGGSKRQQQTNLESRIEDRGSSCFSPRPREIRGPSLARKRALLLLSGRVALTTRRWRGRRRWCRRRRGRWRMPPGGREAVGAGPRWPTGCRRWLPSHGESPRPCRP